MDNKDKMLNYLLILKNFFICIVSPLILKEEISFLFAFKEK